jgi:hypothetical protein
MIDKDNKLAEELVENNANNTSISSKNNCFNEKTFVLNDLDEFLPGSYITRQEMESVSPKFTYTCSLVCSIILCLIFLVCGLPNLLVYSQLKKIEVAYSDW